MASGFVSGGTTDQPIERDDEWLQAQKDIEAVRRRKEEESRQDGGKTLFDVLQQNKAAKQEAFEESIRLKNQFRNLDEDEIEFLDSVLESTRAKEEAVKRETAQQLDIFRQQQEEADKALLSQDGDAADTNHSSIASNLPSDESQWALNGRKRKRGKEKEVLKGVKLRKPSADEVPLALVAKHPSVDTTSVKNNNDAQDKPEHTMTKGTVEANAELPSDSCNEPTVRLMFEEKKAAKSNLGLSGYSSDED